MLLPFGIKTAGDIFIQEMNNIWQDMAGVHVISDDSLIHDKTKQKRNEGLEAVLTLALILNINLKLHLQPETTPSLKQNFVNPVEIMLAIY